MCLYVFILISLATLTSFARVPDNGVFDCGHETGNPEEIKCQNGTGCVLMDHICDGTSDCADGTDEILCPYHNEGSDIQSNISLNRIRRQVKCRSDQWQCRNGYCISMDNLCNGVRDCSDDSDEASPLCRKRAIANPGACILPPYPEHGTYEVEDIPDARPGQSHASVVLTVRCRRGFGVVDLYGDGSGIQQVYCVNGKWRQIVPKCVRFCKLDPDPSIHYMCYTPGTGIAACNNYVSPGTTVDPVCNSPIYYSTEVLRNMRCISGVWNYYAQCKAECGRITPGGKPLLIGGVEAKRGELPWHGAIYRRMPDVFMQICSGTLVSNNVVISAAHCFWKDISKLLPASQFGVAIGKLHRPWDSEEDVDAQKSYVKEIKIENLFDGSAANFQEDIAVLILTTPFNYTTYIRPVCLDFNVNFESLQLQHGVLGKLAGWGLTAANGKPSEILKVLSLPFISVDICIRTLPEEFREYVTGDKFCAGYTNGTAVCHGDSGGGLAFPSQVLGIDRYYLRGIVSTAPKDDDKMCNDHSYTTFTKITKHQNALAESERKVCPLYSFQCADGSCVDPGADCNGRQDCADGSDESDDLCRVGASAEIIALAESERKVCPLYSFQCADGSCVDPGADCNGRQDCADGSDESDDLCRVGASTESIKQTQNPLINTECGRMAEVKGRSMYLNGYSYSKDDIPWLAAVYSTSDGVLNFLCAGTLISRKHVVSVAHAFRTSPIVNAAVQLGRFNSYDWLKDLAITRKVISVNVIDSFNATSLANDLSILTLSRQVEFNTFIRPACLWADRKLPGDSGLFAGWGQERYRNKKDGDPHIVWLKIVSTAVCRASNKAFLHVTSDKTLCAGHLNGSNPCAGDSGGGLYLQDGGQWWLRGVLSLALKPQSDDALCNLNDYVVFTDVSQYLPWIRSIISEDL